MDDPARSLVRLAERYLLTLQEAMAYTGLARSALERLIRQKRLPEIRLKGRRYLTTYDLDHYQMGGFQKKMLTSDRNLYSEDFHAKGYPRVVKMNAHLMSLLQTPGTADSGTTYANFHSRHIAYIAEALDQILPSNYLAVAETSLQVRNEEAIRQPQPDVTIYQYREPTVTSTAAAVLTLPLTLEGSKDWQSIVIYQYTPEETYLTDDHATYGKPVTRIELLSPANMRDGRHYASYEANRNRALNAGIPLVEIDYLHEYRSPVIGVPHYPTDAGSQPYNICVSHPRDGKVYAYLFGLEMPVPTVVIPLAGAETLAFDFGIPYQMTWAKTRALWNIVDYSQEPPRIQTYREADRAYIRQKMQAIHAALT